MKHVVYFKKGNELAGVVVVVNNEAEIVSEFYKKVDAGEIPGFNAKFGILGSSRLFDIEIKK